MTSEEAFVVRFPRQDKFSLPEFKWGSRIKSFRNDNGEVRAKEGAEAALFALLHIFALRLEIPSSVHLL
jgi:hypothetical protein